MDKQRINILDSFRAIAALGVLWVHVWTVHKQPTLYIAGIDFMKPINIIGNGVDLFFVISGFCMYYFYARKNENFLLKDFVNFLTKRWVRLSPVFYFATVVYIVLLSQSEGFENVLKFLTSVFYLNSFSPYNAEGFMWSLGTEWQFYLVIPFLFIFQKKNGFNKSLFYITVFFLITSALSVLLLKKESDVMTNQIIFRYFEFLWGIIIARLYLIKYRFKYNPNLSILIFLLIAYLGRMFLTDQVLSLGGEYRSLFKIIGFNIMPLGFAGLIYTCLNDKNILTKIIGNPFFYFLGKISFSFYLWHGLIHMAIGHLLINSSLNFSNMSYSLINFTVSTIVLIPISYFSYVVFEVKASKYLSNFLK